LHIRNGAAIESIERRQWNCTDEMKYIVTFCAALFIVGFLQMLAVELGLHDWLERNNMLIGEGHWGCPVIVVACILLVGALTIEHGCGDPPPGPDSPPKGLQRLPPPPPPPPFIPPPPPSTLLTPHHHLLPLTPLPAFQPVV